MRDQHNQTNRLRNYFAPVSTGIAWGFHHRPTLGLGPDRLITVDMERFFDFSFSFAEALVELEDRFEVSQNVIQEEVFFRELAIERLQNDRVEEFGPFDIGDDFEIDARWM